MLPNARAVMLLAFIFSVLVADDAPAPAPPPADPVIARLAGSWMCTTSLGSDVVVDAVVGTQGELTMTAQWRNASLDTLRSPQYGSWTQVIRRVSKDTWSDENRLSNGWLHTGLSSGLDGDKLRFEGAQRTTYGVVPTAQLFTFQPGGKAYVHDWIAWSNGPLAGHEPRELHEDLAVRRGSLQKHFRCSTAPSTISRSG